MKSIFFIFVVWVVRGRFYFFVKGVLEGYEECYDLVIYN